MALPLGAALGRRRARGARRPRAPAPLGLLAAAGIVDDVSGGPQLFRRLLPHRPTFNVTGTAGDPGAEETLVFVAHHDAANGGLIFRPGADPARRRHVPGVVRAPERRRRRCCGWWRPGPALAALGALRGSRVLRQLGTFVAAGSALAFFDIGTRTVVPGANDNLTAVAVLLELARMLREQPVRGRPRAARLHRLGGVVHGGHARLGAPPRPRARPASAPASSCSRRSARRS